jgi:hypothetical protein
MFPNALLPIESIMTVFTDEIEATGGKVLDTYQDQARLFVRSVLPRTCDVAQHDQVQAGVALRAADEEISIYPYIFRLVCTNGAILAHVLDTKQITHACGMPLPEIESAVRATVQLCYSEDLFVAAADQLRLARETETSVALNLLPHLNIFPHEIAARFIDAIFNGWMKSRERSRFGLMNVVTALARDTADPEARWRLEELGGRIGIPVLSHSAAAHQARSQSWGNGQPGVRVKQEIL